MLLRFAYLAVTHAFAALRLLPMTDREKDAEILALRHQITVLQRHLGDQRPRLRPEDRALLAALLVPLSRATLRQLRLLVSPDTILRWHRDLMTRRHTRASQHRRPDDPAPSPRSAGWSCAWPPRTPLGVTAGSTVNSPLLGVAVAASTVWEVLKTAGIQPSPQRASVTWAAFLRSQAQALLAMDFIETVTLTGQRQYILAAIHHAGRRVRVLGTTAHPTHAWVTRPCATWSWI